MSAGLAVPAAPGRRRAALVLPLLVLLLAGTGVAALGSGAVPIPPARVVAALLGIGEGGDALVLWHVRLPRLLLGALVGAALAVAGALMQGLFRNPLADPGLLGVSSGASLAAGLTIVLGDTLLAPVIGRLPFAALPVGAFLGGLAVTLLLYAVATQGGRTSTATLLLAGVAVGAFTGALMGLLAYASDDRQLRDLSFWSLGSLSGATWAKLAAAAPLILPALAATPFLARGLNALALGEAEAFHLGFSVERLKGAIILLVAVAVGACVAVSGLIGFVGIVAAHALRLAIGPDHRRLLPAAALFGAVLLVGADTLARSLVAPAELPVGIVTAFVGAPFFLWLLLRREAGLA
ncbi:MAG TPA: iron ABC transporter permease [Beijerinckiaceae bacterium]|jgi:iron complex transport system permease protein